MLDLNNFQTTVELTITCPGAYDQSSKCPVTPVKWHWRNCKHRSHIDQEANIICKECDHEHFIQHIQFKCHSSKHGNSYKKFKASEFCIALSAANSAINWSGLDQKEQMQFIANITNKVNEKWEH